MNGVFDFMKDKNLIIIASQPRSGSTLLQALLSNNELVGTVSEPWLLLPFLGYNDPHLTTANYDSELALSGINDFKSKIGPLGFDKDLSEFLLTQYKKVQKNKEIYVLDKTPRYYEILNEILKYFPNCKIIILKRNPLAVINSIINTWNVNTVNGMLVHHRDILNAPFLLQDFSDKQKDNPNVYELLYEDLVSSPEVIVKDIYNFIDIPFNESILNYNKNEKYKGLMGDPKGVKNKKSPSKSSLFEWEALQTDDYWSDFIAGYSNWLGKDFFKTYGNSKFLIENIKFKDSKKFNAYLDRVNWSFRVNEVPKWQSIIYLIKRRLGILNY